MVVSLGSMYTADVSVQVYYTAFYRPHGSTDVTSKIMHKITLCIIWRQTSTANKTLPVPDLYIVHFVVWFGDVDTSAGGSTEAGGLSHALPTYDPRDTLA